VELTVLGQQIHGGRQSTFALAVVFRINRDQ
jgi:hypothetical protein